MGSTAETVGASEVPVGVGDGLGSLESATALSYSLGFAVVAVAPSCGNTGTILPQSAAGVAATVTVEAYPEPSTRDGAFAFGSMATFGGSTNSFDSGRLALVLGSALILSTTVETVSVPILAVVLDSFNRFWSEYEQQKSW